MEKIVQNDYKTALEKAGAISIVPTGNSMWPILKHNSQSVLVEAKKDRLKPLDVALYTYEDKYVLHRVLKVLPEGYVMCGDAMNVLEKVPENAVFGKMVGFYKKDVFVSCEDKDYINYVQKWYKHRIIRKIRLACFHLRLKLKFGIRKIFGRKDK